MEKMFLKINSEYGKLKTVLIHNAGNLVHYTKAKHLDAKYGSFFEEEQKNFPEKGIWNNTLVKKQHRVFLEILSGNGIELIYLNTVTDAIYQLFTRDIGFVVGETFFKSRMGDGIRRLEQKAIDKYSKIFSKFVEINAGRVEGGDVFVHGENIFVGITKYSTNIEGFNFLKKYLNPLGFKCIPIRCSDNVLHLDCRFNIISLNMALIYKEDIHPSDVKKLEKSFSLINLTRKELYLLSANVLVLSPKEIISNTRSKRLNYLLRKEGFEIIEVDYSEITKMSGSFRCTTLPLVRV